MDELMVYEAHAALAEAKRTNYAITSPLTGQTAELKRDVDFGVIPKTKQPSLYKAGAEKIAMAYGLMQTFSVETKIEQTEGDPLFYYLVKCELKKSPRTVRNMCLAPATDQPTQGKSGTASMAHSTPPTVR